MQLRKMNADGLYEIVKKLPGHINQKTRVQEVCGEGYLFVHVTRVWDRLIFISICIKKP